MEYPHLKDERMRMSRVDWDACMPQQIALEQYAYERRMVALRMRDAGFKFRDIGERFGVGAHRAWMLVQIAERARRRGQLSPAEAFFGGREKHLITRDDKRLVVKAVLHSEWPRPRPRRNKD